MGKIVILLISFLFLANLASAGNSVVLKSYIYIPYLNEGKGMVEEILKTVFKDSKYEFAIETFPLARAKLEFLNDPKAIFGASEKMKEGLPKDKYEFIPIANVRFTFLLKSSTKDITKEEELKQYSVGDLIGSSYQKELEAAVKKLELVSSHESNIKKLESGRIDAIYSVDFTLNEIAEKYFPNEKEKFKQSSFDRTVRVGVYVPISAKELGETIKNRLKEIIKSKEYEKIMLKFYKDKIPENAKIKLEDIK